MRNAIEQFKNAIRSAGLVPPDDIEPGKLHRFPGMDKGRGDDAGRCMLFEDRRGGWYMDYSTGLKGTWQAERDKPYTPGGARSLQTALRRRTPGTRSRGKPAP